MPTGVPGLDEPSGGGIPEFSFNIIAGTPGCVRKTTLAHQTAFANATVKNPALYFTVLGELALKMLRYQQQYFLRPPLGGPFCQPERSRDEEGFDRGVRGNRQSGHSAQPGSCGGGLFSHRRAQSHRRHEGSGDAIVHPGTAQFLTSWEATTFLVGEYAPEEMRDNPVFTVADSLLWLSQVAERNSVGRKLQIYKVRGQATRSRVCTPSASPGTGCMHFRALWNAGGKQMSPLYSRPRLSLGIDELRQVDERGAAPKATASSVAGPSGTGKSAIATQLAAADCARGEPAVMAPLKSVRARLHDRAASLVAPQEIAENGKMGNSLPASAGSFLRMRSRRRFSMPSKGSARNDW